MLVTELLTLFREPDRDVDQVVQLISYEPSLTAQILRLCNSASFAGQRAPDDIFEAVSRVGFYQVYCMVATLFGARTKSMEGVDQGLNADELWRHSVAVAVSAGVAADETGQTKAVAFTAGLLHDIGKLVLASVERQRYAALIQRAKDEGLLLTDLERSVLMMDHAEVSGELMQRWNLPPEIVAAVRHHHDPVVAPPYEQLIAAVQVGDVIGHQFFAEDLAGTDLLTFSPAALDILGLTPDDFPRLLAKVQSEMDQVKGMLGI
jgi:putative nucleotidyltransferase with HDIG domain